MVLPKERDYSDEPQDLTLVLYSLVGMSEMKILTQNKYYIQPADNTQLTR